MASHLRLVIGLPVGLGVLAVVFAALTRQYEATARFAPESSETGLRGLGTLAAQFGLPLNFSGESESVDFYDRLIRSRDLLLELAKSRFRVAWEPGSQDTLEGTLFELYRISGETEWERNHAMTRRLANDIKVGTDRAANMVVVRVRTPWPLLAEAVADRVVELVNDFNLRKRQTRGAAERRFVEERLEEARRELREAEAALEAFQMRNRRYTDSPELVLEHRRLERQVDLRQQVYTSLAQAYEQARISEVRNTPVISLIESAAGSARPTGRLAAAGVFGAALGGVLAIGYVLLAAYLSEERARDPAAYGYVRSRLARVLRFQAP
jgi:uncharacterized protein involved in exopolysaccharide biosynthesis